MRGVKAFLLTLLFTIPLCVVSAQADERSEALDREATNLYQQVFSPFCPGRSLNDCPSSKAAELKDEMRAQLEAGQSGEEVLRGVFQKYGDQYRAVPQFSGVGMLVWLVPASFVLLGLLLAIKMSLKRKGAKESASTSAVSSLSDEERRKVQEELARME